MKFIKKRYIALLTLLSSVSLVGTGFSSWYMSCQISDTATGSITVPAIEGDIPGIYYISNSEYSFDYYQMDGIYYFTTSSIGIKMKMNIPEFYTNLPSDKSDVYLKLNLSYTYSGSSDLDLFSSNNSYTTPPTKSRMSLVDLDSYYIESEDIVSSSSSASGKNYHKLESKICAFSLNKYSLYSLAKSYSTSNILYFWAEFNFEIKDSFTNIFNEYKNLEFRLEFNAMEASS